MAKRKRRAPRKLAVQWVTPEGEVLDFVDRTPSDLPIELARVRSHGLLAAKVLSRLKRLRNAEIIRARFELEHCQRPEPEDVPAEWYAQEIARLSYVYQQVLQVLNRLCHARTRWLEETRFLLTYGQTPKKREPAGTYGSRNKQTTD